MGIRGYGEIQSKEVADLQSALKRTWPARLRLFSAIGRYISPPILIAALFCITAVFVADGLLRNRGSFDYWLINTTQQFDVPYLGPALNFSSELTGSFWAINLWLIVFASFCILRWWLPALAAFMIPIAGGINMMIGWLVQRPRPEPDQLQRAISGTEATAFPSGHVVGAVLLYGLLFFVAGRKISNPLIRLPLQLLAVAVIVTVGFARIWLGAHWVGDVVAAYALGAALLVALIWLYISIDTAVGDIPFIRAAAVPHDESKPHAHALTSTILFNGPTVSKIYAPGFVPRAIYWLAFQAEFPYMRNRDALEAAVLRRNLAGKLTEYWYGSNRVARAIGIDEVDGRLAITSEYIEGHETLNPQVARNFLDELVGHFEDSGLPTWQVDPRQPRARDNLIETRGGLHYIIDLESGLVSPMASPRAWWRAFRRGEAPIYDDVDFELTRSYIKREREQMRSQLGDRWVAELDLLVAEADAAEIAWHEGEPRIWSRFLKSMWSSFGIGAWPKRLQATTARGKEKATGWMESNIVAWQNDTRLTSNEAERVSAQLESPQVQAVIPHFGVHLLIGIATRFPIGSILRASYVLLNMALATGRFLLRKIDLRAWRQTMSIHSPLVLLIAATPGIGTFAYLFSKPVRSNHLLLRIVLDAVLLKLPFTVYERTGLRWLIAKPTNAEQVADRSTPVSISVRPERIAIILVAIAVVFAILDVILQTTSSFFDPGFAWWDDLVELSDLNNARSLASRFTIILLAICAGLILIVTVAKRGTPGGAILKWGALAWVILAVALDEILFSGLVTALRFAEDDWFFEAWILSFFAWLLVLAAGFIAVRFLIVLPPDLRILFLMAAGFWLAGALGVELLAKIWTRNGYETLRYQNLTSLEELLELIGVILLIYALLCYIRTSFKELRLWLQPANNQK